jgi:hypothetical protein
MDPDDLLQKFQSVVMGSTTTNDNVDPTQNISPEQKAQLDLQKEEEAQLNDYKTAIVPLRQLIDSWRTEDTQTEANRLKRDIDINLDQLREDGTIDDDETFIPVRVIDTNITRETPPFINFLKNARRIAIFNDTVDPTFDTALLESAFTKGMTYKGWIKPFYKTVDGAATHGWASVEITYDESKPLRCGIEYIAHEDLIFYTETRELQASQDTIRRYRLTILQLHKYVVQFGFDPVQVNNIIEKWKTSQDKDKPIIVYKGFHKKDGIVYVRWFSIEGAATDWIKKPEPLSLGICKQVTVMKTVMQPTIGVDPVTNQPTVQNVPQQVPTQEWQPVPLQAYPIAILPYRETEKPLIFDHLGRCFFDNDKQEAMTAITTSYVNGMNRAMRIFASPKADTIQDGRPAKNLPIKLANGTIWDKPMDFYNMPYPSPDVLKALQYLSTANSDEVGQVNFAANNRQDSRKTATEINAAEKESNLLDTVDLTLFSEFIRDVYTIAWAVVQSQALQGSIKFLQIKNPALQQNPQIQQQNLLLGSIVNSDGSVQDEAQLVNDIDTISRNFEIRAAGDVDVIAKEEMVQKMQRDWPVIQQTPLASRFISDYVKLVYPEDGELYSQILQTGDPKNNIIKGLLTALEQIIQMPEVHHLITPQVSSMLQQLEQSATMAINPQAASQKQSSPQPQPQNKQLPQAQVGPKPDGPNSPQNQPQQPQ